jgi:hypothetical protein
MRQVCYNCKILYGIKEPLDDDSETHGLCPECFELEMAKLDTEQKTDVDPSKDRTLKF